MKKKIIFSDCHWNSLDAEDVRPEFGEDVIYIGDNHEFKNIDVKDVPMLISKYRDFLTKAHMSGTRVLSGNHEVSVGNKFCWRYNDTIYDIQGKGVLYIHGPEITWSKNKYKKWKVKPPGMSKFKRKISCFLSKLRSKIGTRGTLSKKKLKKASDLAKEFECSTIVFGHTHPSKLIDQTYNGVRVVNVPRGRTELYL